MELSPSSTPAKRATALNYATVLKDIGRESLLKKSTTKLFGYEDVMAEIKRKLNTRKSFIATGPRGVGKTAMIRRIAEGSKLNYIYIKAKWLTSKSLGDPEKFLSCVFKEALEKSPSVIFIDNLDCICESRKALGDVKERALDWLEDRLDELSETDRDKVVVILALHDRSALDKNVSKYFFHEICFRLPTESDRFKMAKALFPKFLLNEQEFISKATHCYLYKDLQCIRDIAMDLDPTKLTFESVKVALSKYKPETVRDYTSPCQRILWEDIGGLEAVKKVLQDKVIRPLKRRERSEKYNIKMAKGALLYGPPGCSKTMLAQALANESGFNFISVKGPELFSKYVGDSEKAVRQLYRRAREIAPCIIFFDEIDGFASDRSNNSGSSVNEKVVAQLLAEFNEQPDNVFTLAATNRPQAVEMALLRPGRLKPTIYIPLPSKNDRAEIFKVHMRRMPIKFDRKLDEVVQDLASKTDGYSGAEIWDVCNEASFSAFLEEQSEDYGDPNVELSRFEEALKKVKPTTNLAALKSYEEFQERMNNVQQVSMDSFQKRELNEKFNASLSISGRPQKSTLFRRSLNLFAAGFLWMLTFMLYP